MNSGSVEVRRLIQTFTSVLQQSNESFSAADISSMFFGLQQMNSDASPIRSILHTLGNICERTMNSEDFSPKIIGYLAVGLQSMNNDNVAVNQILKHFDQNDEHIKDKIQFF